MRSRASKPGYLSRKEFLKLGAGASAGLLTAGGLLGGCGSQASSNSLTVAYQPGIGYAQLLILKQTGWLAEDLDGMEVSWTELSSGSAVRDGMVSGEIQVGAGGIAPFLIGFDQGLEWRILSSLNNIECWLMVKEERLRSLSDFESEDRIAMPAPDSLQAVVLRRGAQKELSNAQALTENIVSLEHPAALQSLTSGQVAGHLASPPFQFQEQNRGSRPILKSFDLFGTHSFNNLFVMNDYHDQNPQVMEALYANIRRATRLLREDPGEAASILAKESGQSFSSREFEDYLTEEGVEYTVEPAGYMAFANFMQEVALIDQAPGSWKDLVFDNVK